MRLRDVTGVAREVESQSSEGFARRSKTYKTQRRMAIGVVFLGLFTLSTLTQRPPRFLETGVSGSLETATQKMRGSSVPEPTNVSRIRVCRCPKQDPDHEADSLKEVKKDVPILRNCMNENPDGVKINCFWRLMGCVETIWKNFSGSICVERSAALKSPLADDSPFFLSEIVEKVAPCRGNLTERESLEIVSDAVQTYPCLVEPYKAV